MIDRAALEHALLVHGSLDWDEHDIGIFADELINDSALDSPAAFAHVIWTMGAVKDHEGCRYGGEDANDGDYSNECAECEAYLRELGVRVIAAMEGTKR